MEATYVGIHLWKQALEKAGTTDVDKVIEAAYGQKFNAPCGFELELDANHHLHKPVFIGEVRPDLSLALCGKQKLRCERSPGAPLFRETKASLTISLRFRSCPSITAQTQQQLKKSLDKGILIPQINYKPDGSHILFPPCPGRSSRLRKYLIRFSLNGWLATGDGLAIDPLDRRVLSPRRGKVTQVHRKRHAVTLATDEGVEPPVLGETSVLMSNRAGDDF
jgi:Periplasmic binding protein domain/phosphoenolpyruvate-dependent sugar phosphotransferase system, EIIA 1